MEKYKKYRLISNVLWFSGIGLMILGLIFFSYCLIKLEPNKPYNLIYGIIIFAVGAALSTIIYKPFRNYVISHCSKCYESLLDAEYSCLPIDNSSRRGIDNVRVYKMKFSINYHCPHCNEKFNEIVKITSERGYRGCENRVNRFCLIKFKH